MNSLEAKKGDNLFLLKGEKIKKPGNQYTGPYELLDGLGKGNIENRL